MLIRNARKNRGWTQAQLAEMLGTSQSAINRIEQGNQNLSLDLLTRLSEALDSEIVSLGRSGPLHLRVEGGRRLRGSIDVKTSKNAGVGLLCASLLNEGRTVLRKVARIEEVHRILEVLDSIGVRSRWLNSDNDLEIVPPSRLDLANLDLEAARRTRSIIMFLAPLMRHEQQFELPYAGGCALGNRTVEPHMTALRPFGLQVEAAAGAYRVEVRGGAPAATDRADRTRRHGHRERADGRSPQRRGDGDPQRQLQLHGAGPVLLPDRARRTGGRHRHHHADRARRAGDPQGRRLLAVGGSDRGDEPGHRGHRDRLGDHRVPGADRVHGDRAGAAGRDGAALRPDGRSTSPPTARPGWWT